MDGEIEIVGIQIPQSDWDATPESVKAVVTVLSERLAYIEEQLNQNSQNSSRPPSSDGFVKPEKSKVQKKKKAEKKPSHGSSSRKKRKIYPIEACKEVYSHVPEKCRHCGEELCGEDAQPYRHQIVEIPTRAPYIIEHQQHQLDCACCGRKTRGTLPKGVPSTGYGDRLAAVVAWLSGEHRQSYRMVESLMATLFSVELSRGSINRLRHQVSEAVAVPVEQAHQYVQGQEVVHSDETGYPQGNGDGKNPKQTKGWLWVLATPLVKVFLVALSRAQATAKALSGTSTTHGSDLAANQFWFPISSGQ